jgi:hypothetical protein
MWTKPSQQPGFVLLSVLLLGLVIITSGLALQAMAWQGFSSQQRQWRRDQAADAAISKAMRLALD